MQLQFTKLGLAAPKEQIDEHWMLKAGIEAVKSPDPSSQNGAVLVFDQTIWIGSGHNDFPPGIKSTPERWNDRPTKYGLVLHAEVAAIVSTIRNGWAYHVKGSTLYAVWGCCTECAKIILAYGVSRVVILRDDHSEHWLTEREAGLSMLQEGGVEITELSTAPANMPSLRRNYQLLSWSSSP